MKRLGADARAYLPDLLVLLRYGAVGVAQNAVAYAVLIGLTFWGLKAWQATAIIYPVAAVISYFAHRTISFRSQAAKGQLTRYLIVYIAGYVLAVGFTALQEGVGVPSWAAALVTMVLAAGGMFAAMRWWVFRPGAASSFN